MQINFIHTTNQNYNECAFGRDVGLFARSRGGAEAVSWFAPLIHHVALSPTRHLLRAVLSIGCMAAAAGRGANTVLMLENSTLRWWMLPKATVGVLEGRYIKYD